MSSRLDAIKASRPEVTVRLWIDDKPVSIEEGQVESVGKTDLDWLIAEVERLTAERDAATQRAETAERELAEVRDAVYIEDCHVTGTHDPRHTPQYPCERQLAGLAQRVLTVLFGVKWNRDGTPCGETINQIPRRLNRRHGSWYGYYERRGNSGDSRGGREAAALQRWAVEGFPQAAVPAEKGGSE